MLAKGGGVRVQLQVVSGEVNTLGSLDVGKEPGWAFFMATKPPPSRPVSPSAQLYPSAFPLSDVLELQALCTR